MCILFHPVFFFFCFWTISDQVEKLWQKMKVEHPLHLETKVFWISLFSGFGISPYAVLVILKMGLKFKFENETHYVSHIFFPLVLEIGPRILNMLDKHSALPLSYTHTYTYTQNVICIGQVSVTVMKCLRELILKKKYIRVHWTSLLLLLFICFVFA